MDKRRQYSLLVAVLFFLIGRAAAASGEEIRIGGGGAALLAVFQPIKPHFEKATGITLINLQSSPKGGLLNLIEGRVDITAAAHSLEGLIAALRADGVVFDPAALVAHEVGINRIALFVHPSNRVGGLSREQLKGVFTGRITNWKEVGGDDRDILVVWGRGTPGQNADFARRVLDGESVTPRALETTNYVEIRETIAATPEAIGIDPISVANPTVKLVGSDAPLTTPIISITIGQPSAKVRRLLDYIKGEGKAYLLH
ncbi:MAG: substrate-binding domain-containing protein [Candidatus Accumulibacter sp.]|uniref:Substrate-binding domain-containing protein n=1 Tax=Candidatus Accumulibacter proximus TaxID=2954385 RepID=A0A935PXR2_9PROT|nr:substrate-binding domain-containing protein [Candidatus Accumulibacter proximus]